MSQHDDQKTEPAANVGRAKRFLRPVLWVVAGFASAGVAFLGISPQLQAAPSSPVPSATAAPSSGSSTPESDVTVPFLPSGVSEIVLTRRDFNYGFCDGTQMQSSPYVIFGKAYWSLTGIEGDAKAGLGVPPILCGNFPQGTKLDMFLSETGDVNTANSQGRLRLADGFTEKSIEVKGELSPSGYDLELRLHEDETGTPRFICAAAELHFDAEGYETLLSCHAVDPRIVSSSREESVKIYGTG